MYIIGTFVITSRQIELLHSPPPLDYKLCDPGTGVNVMCRRAGADPELSTRRIIVNRH